MPDRLLGWLRYFVKRGGLNKLNTRSGCEDGLRCRHGQTKILSPILTVSNIPGPSRRKMPGTFFYPNNIELQLIICLGFPPRMQCTYLAPRFILCYNMVKELVVLYDKENAGWTLSLTGPLDLRWTLINSAHLSIFMSRVTVSIPNSHLVTIVMTTVAIAQMLPCSGQWSVRGRWCFSHLGYQFGVGNLGMTGTPCMAACITCRWPS